MFVAEGSTDVALVPHLERLCVRAGASEAEGIAPDLSSLPVPPGKTVKAQVIAALELAGEVELVFVHRDADQEDPSSRISTITSGLKGVDGVPPFVCVVPVQETEAWLLTDEAAIREVAGNPHGKTPLNLPKLGTVEMTRSPKEKLREALEAACCHTGRRLRDFKGRFSHHRSILLERLDIDGPVSQLGAWKQLIEDTTSAVSMLRAK